MRFLMPEKMAMTDGRIDNKKLTEVLKKTSFTCTLFDANQVAKESGAIVNAVMLGAVAAADVIGITLDEFIEAIRFEGKAVDSNISGINAGFTFGGRSTIVLDIEDISLTSSVINLDGLFPESAHEIIKHGIDRLLDYQNKHYVETYLARLKRFKASDPVLLTVVAKQLALRMAYEDIIRVAQAKVRPERFTRIRNEAKSSSEDIVIVTDFFKQKSFEVGSEKRKVGPFWI